MPESLFNKIRNLYPASLLKENTPMQVLSDEFCEIFKTPVLKNSSRWLLLFYRQIFYQWNSKKPSEKRKKQQHTHKKQLKHYSPLVFISFYHSKFSLFHFSLLPMIHWKHVFSENMQFHWGFTYYSK